MARIIAFDFDGTLCSEAFPMIGRPKTAMIRYAKRCKKRGDSLILWTCRCGDKLQEAVDWCEKQGLVFDAINQNVPETLEKYGTESRKITADYYIDDKSFALPKLLWSLV